MDPRYEGETIYLRRDTGRPEDVVLVRPEDLDAGAMETVFPFRESDRGDHDALLEALRGIRNATMLIRLRTEDAARVTKRKGQESFNYGDYFAFSKICTHLAAPPPCTNSRPTESSAVPPVAVRCADLRKADFRSGRSCTSAVAYYSERRGFPSHNG